MTAESDLGAILEGHCGAMGERQKDCRQLQRVRETKQGTRPIEGIFHTSQGGNEAISR